MQATIVPVEDARQTQQAAELAAQIARDGGLIVFPTETVYGLGASAASAKGYEALRQVKGAVDQPFTVHLPDPGAAERYINVGHALVARLIRKVFPGPVTLVVEVSEDEIHRKIRDLGLPPEARNRVYHQNTIGLRCPDHPVAHRVLDAIGGPVLASGASPRGVTPPVDADDAARVLGDQVDLIIDGGRCRYGKPSTVVRVRGEGRFTVDPGGVYDERYIRKLLRWTMLVVCSGNTCRSPMAEGLARKTLADQRGIRVDELEQAGLRVLSAGAFAAPGMPPSPEAVEALRKFDVDIAGHRSRVLSVEMVHEADVIYCMTATHQQAVLNLVPSAAGKTFLLDPSGDVEDPIGSGATAYQRCAEIIRRRLAQRLKEQQP